MKDYFIKKAWLLLIVSALVSCTTLGQKSTPPNIVVILADDLGWKDVGYNGAEFYETPNIDALANSGMVFTNAYAAGPNCAPARASLLSGLYTPKHKLYTPGGKSKGKLQYMKLKVPTKGAPETFQTFVSNNDAINPNIICIPEVLKEAGYISARFGKWHIGPDTQGFDISSSNGTDLGLEKKHYGDIDIAEQLTDAAISFIETTKDKPFFLYLSHWDVHTPLRARPEVIAKYDQKQQTTATVWNTTYAAMIEAVDTSVGRVVKKLEELQLSENTLVVFLSDNGGHTHITKNHPLKAGKGSLHEGGIRVPTVFSWPGTIPQKSVNHSPISSVDFLPTFSDLAQLKLPKTQDFDGASLAPMLLGKEKTRNQDIFWHYPLYLKGFKGNRTLAVSGTETPYWRATPASAIRSGPWKLIQYFEDGSVQLFNLDTDISEQHDVSRTEKEVVANLLRKLKAWQNKTGAPIPKSLNPQFAPN
ncbi:sulfatase [Sediminicola luteus]|uniref:Sulfatase N-terminal domain-containing protein n=1 Tax=Sediminicola luteus TaxID=319238 RepID=A0A2A4GDP3_9FLAO|nr:sulfatase [Sediminicola luteus]PCE66697.1 hypothetical protein B7P33_05245 [Sediminicola luteus]